MKFPLAVPPFDPLVLSDEEKVTIQSTVDRVLADTLAEYERVLIRNNGEIDLERWKAVKTKENIVAYEDRCALAIQLQQTSSSAKPRAASEDPVQPPPAPTTTKTPLQWLLWHGTVNCEVEDVMFSLTNQTGEHWQIRSSYVDDNVVDVATLASLKSATPDKPFEGLQIKWMVNNLGRFIPSGLIRYRDNVFIDATGMTTTSTGEKIGYEIMYNIELPGLPELPQYKLVRADMRTCWLFRQKSKGVVELYCRSIMDLQGGVPSYVSSLFSAEAIYFLSNAVSGAQKRKLSYMMHTADHHKLSSGSEKFCGVCSKDISKNPLTAFSAKTCRVCANRVCSRCKITKKISFLNRQTRGVVKRSVDCCTKCIHTASQMSALEIAQNAAAMDNPLAFYYETALRTRSSVSSSASER